MKQTRQWLGLSDLSMTVNIYSQLDIGRKTETGAAMSKVQE